MEWKDGKILNYQIYSPKSQQLQVCIDHNWVAYHTKKNKRIPSLQFLQAGDPFVLKISLHKHVLFTITCKYEKQKRQDGSRCFYAESAMTAVLRLQWNQYIVFQTYRDMLH
ncbi:hypothetical protein [Sphingobacterium sp. E70]|uniref:hypothetical protein n=1 Tax=Sphingobacterium sp. E70 TaxID=2853439 RepID=UPI00359C6D92